MNSDLATICRLLDLKPRRVQQLAIEGVMIRSDRGGYDLVRSVRGYVQYLADRADRAVSGAADPILDRKRLADAKLAEMKLDVRRDATLPAAEVAAMQQRVATTVRAQFEGLPRAIARKVKPSLPTGKVETIIRAEIDVALEALSNPRLEEIPSAVDGDNTEK